MALNEAVNLLVGGPPPQQTVHDEPAAALESEGSSRTLDDNDATPFFVAAFVVGAVLLVIGMRWAGFQGVIAASGKVSLG